MRVNNKLKTVCVSHSYAGARFSTRVCRQGLCVIVIIDTYDATDYFF